MLLELGGGRAARAWFVNAHLHHVIGDADVRAGQMRALLDWMDDPVAVAAAAHTIVVGDFNAPPGEPAYALLAARGYVRAVRICISRMGRPCDACKPL